MVARSSRSGVLILVILGLAFCGAGTYASVKDHSVTNWFEWIISIFGAVTFAVAASLIRLRMRRRS